MSAQDDKNGLMGTAEIQYQRLVSLLARAGNPELPEEFGKTMKEFGGRGSISISEKFMGSLWKNQETIDVSENLRPELKRIANFNECLAGWSDEAKAQLSADCIHLQC